MPPVSVRTPDLPVVEGWICRVALSARVVERDVPQGVGADEVHRPGAVHHHVGERIDLAVDRRLRHRRGVVGRALPVVITADRQRPGREDIVPAGHRRGGAEDQIAAVDHRAAAVRVGARQDQVGRQGLDERHRVAAVIDDGAVDHELAVGIDVEVGNPGGQPADVEGRVVGGFQHAAGADRQGVGGRGHVRRRAVGRKADRVDRPGGHARHAVVFDVVGGAGGRQVDVGLVRGIVEARGRDAHAGHVRGEAVRLTAQPPRMPLVNAGAWPLSCVKRMRARVSLLATLKSIVAVLVLERTRFAMVMSFWPPPVGTTGWMADSAFGRVTVPNLYCDIRFCAIRGDRPAAQRDRRGGRDPAPHPLFPPSLSSTRNSA